MKSDKETAYFDYHLTECSITIPKIQTQ